MQRVCLVLGTPFSQDHDEVLSLATLVPPPSVMYVNAMPVLGMTGN